MQEILLPALFLLLPLAVWSGYRIGRKKAQPKNLERRLAPGYFTGLNFLLNEEPDKAIDAFIELLQVDSETVETHLALGNLFRRRGEVDRAIRIHQNLIARPSLTGNIRKLALLELASDYMAAGLFDRAENLFEELLKDQQHQLTSLIHLDTIYQQMKDWPKAIRMSLQIEQNSTESRIHNIAHYYCEIAEDEIAKGNSKAAFDAINKALKSNRASVRASMLEGKLFRQAGKYKKAIASYRRIRHQDIAYLPEVLDDLLQCYQQVNGEQELTQYLQECLDKGAGVSVLLALATLLQSQEGDQSAATLISDYLRANPSLKGLEQLIQMHIQHASGEAKNNLELLHGLVMKLMIQKPVYCCVECGFSGKTLFWKCPSCSEWGTTKPIFGIEGE